MYGRLGEGTIVGKKAPDDDQLRASRSVLFLRALKA